MFYIEFKKFEAVISDKHAAEYSMYRTSFKAIVYNLFRNHITKKRIDSDPEKKEVHRRLKCREAVLRRVTHIYIDITNIIINISNY